MRFIAILIMLLCIFSCESENSAASHNNIVKGNTVIFTNTVSILNNNLEMWQPRIEDIENLIPKIKSFIEINNNDSFGTELAQKKENMIKYFNKYYIQCYGYILNGKRCIYFNFFLQSIKEWENQFIIIKDGGFSVWHIEFNTIDKVFYNYCVNGEA